MSLRTQYISSHLFFLTPLQQRASVAPSLLLCQYGDSATLCVCFLRSGGHSLSVFLSLRHCSCCVTAPTAWSQGFRTPLWGSAHFCPTFRLSTPNGSQILIVWKRLCLIGQSSSRIQWPRWAELLHQPVSLAIGHPEYHGPWVKHQFSVQPAMTKEAGLWLTSCQPCIEHCLQQLAWQEGVAQPGNHNWLFSRTMS